MLTGKEMLSEDDVKVGQFFSRARVRQPNGENKEMHQADNACAYTCDEKRAGSPSSASFWTS